MSETDPIAVVDDHPLRRKIAVIALCIVCSAVSGYVAVDTFRNAWPITRHNYPYRAPLLLVAAVLMWIAVWSVGSLLRRKWKTGRFLLRPSEAAKIREEAAAKLGAGKPAGPQWPLWLIPLLLSLFALWLAGMLISVTPFSTPLTAGDVFFLLLVAYFICLGLIYPFIAIRRKLRTGSFLPSQERLAERRARCAMPKSLKKRIATAAVWWLVASVWTFSAFRSGQRHHNEVSHWLTATLSCLAAIIWTKEVFWPRPPQCGLPAASGETAEKY